MSDNELDDHPYRAAHPPWWPGDESGYQDYHRQRYAISSTTSGFARWKILSSGINICRQLAGARNLGRATYIREHGPDQTAWPLPHPPAVLWTPAMAHAACLGCMWLGDSSGDAGEAAGSARRHAASFLPPSGPGLRLLLEPLPVWHRTGADAAPRRAG